VDVWKQAHFGSNATNSSIAGDAADPDHDGIPNLLEYASATDPNVTNASSFQCARLAGNYFQLRFPRNIFATDVVYVLQTANSLTNWNTLMAHTPGPGWQALLGGWSVSESGTNGTGLDQFVNVTVASLSSLTAGGATNQFFRLQIHRY
jgi:hypothetical protein